MLSKGVDWKGHICQIIMQIKICISEQYMQREGTVCAERRDSVCREKGQCMQRESPTRPMPKGSEAAQSFTWGLHMGTSWCCKGTNPSLLPQPQTRSLWIFLLLCLCSISLHSRSKRSQTTLTLKIRFSLLFAWRHPFILLRNLR